MTSELYFKDGTFKRIYFMGYALEIVNQCKRDGIEVTWFIDGKLQI